MRNIGINKLKLRRNILYLIIAILAISLVFVFSPSLSSYVSNGTTTANIGIAYSLLNVDGLSDSISLTNIEPNDEEHVYRFSVMNYDDDNNRIDVNMKYMITIITTTNLNIEYVLYDEDDNVIETTNEIITDEYGTIFNTLKTEYHNMTYQDNKIDTYTIKYKLSSDYKDSKYQDVIDLLSIKIDATQV